MNRERAQEGRRLFYLYATGLGGVAGVLILVSALLNPASASPYLLITQPLLIAFSFLACALLWTRRVRVSLLEQSAMLLLTSVVLGRSLLEVFSSQPPPVVLDSQALIGLLLCVVSGFLVLKRQAALTFVGSLFLIQALALGVGLWVAPAPPPWAD